MLDRKPPPYKGAALAIQRHVLLADEASHAILQAPPRQLDLVLRIDQMACPREWARPLRHRQDGRVGVGEDGAPLLRKTRQVKGVNNSCDFRDCYAA